MCSVDECEGKVVGRGWCRKHYSRWSRYGDPLAVRRQYAPTRQCRNPDCSNEIPGHGGKQPRAYCSQRCYHATSREQNFRDRQCEHCGGTYTPKGTKQRWCFTCLGPAVKRPNGTIRYEGARRLKEYGVSWPEWLAMVAKHDGKCWLCLRRAAVALDHCHTTGRPRGALCSKCNRMLADIEDSGWLGRTLVFLGVQPTG